MGLVGIGGVITGNPGLFGFFGFFGFFAVTFQQEDELLRWNLARAGLNGFVVSLSGLAIAIAVVAVQRSFQWLALMVGVRRETIVHIEKGRYNLSLLLAWRIARELDSTLDELFQFEP